MKRTSQTPERQETKRRPSKNKEDLVIALLDARRLGKIRGGNRAAWCFPTFCWDEDDPDG